MKSCSKKILIDMIKPKKNTMHLLCRLTPNKNRDFDTMGIKVTVLNFCLCYGLFQLL